MTIKEMKPTEFDVEAEKRECLICQQPKDNHDQIVCDTVRSVLSARAKRAA